MVMGPTHAMSGVALWLGATAAAVPVMGVQSVPEIAVGAAVCAGSALLPDLDCPGSLALNDGSTVVRAFGVVGDAVGHALSGLSLVVYNLTRSRYDPPKNQGHRTLTHTFVFTAGLGALVSLGASTPGTFEAFGRHWEIGTVVTLGVMWACLHLALFGLCEKWVKKQRAKYGLLGVMVVSGGLTALTGSMLPNPAHGYPWLGLAVGAGAVMHCLGDAITKMGVPVLWPIPIHGKRWYDVTLPSFMRIRAGGMFEYAVLLPSLTLFSMGAVLWMLPGGAGIVRGLGSALGV